MSTNSCSAYFLKVSAYIDSTRHVRLARVHKLVVATTFSVICLDVSSPYHCNSSMSEVCLLSRLSRVAPKLYEYTCTGKSLYYQPLEVYVHCCLCGWQRSCFRAASSTPSSSSSRSTRPPPSASSSTWSGTVSCCSAFKTFYCCHIMLIT